MTMQEAYFEYKLDKILAQSRWVLGIGSLLLCYFVFADLHFRNAPEIAFTRFPPILIACIFLILNKLKPETAYIWGFPVFHSFLFALVLMQLAIIYMDFETAYFHSAISGTVVVIFIIALVMRANTFSALLILVLPLIFFILLLFIQKSPEGNRLVELANPMAMVVAAFVMNQINESLRFREFKSGCLLQEEKEKTEQLLQQEHLLNDEINSQNIELEQSKNELETINQNLQDSLNYARELQNTILPNVERLKKYFDDYLLFFKPKNTVSGDFYWLKETDQKLFFAVADATGHGVPAAFLSILGINFLNEIIEHNKLLSPAEILDVLRKRIINNFGDDDESLKDGIDMALCCWDKQTKTLTYAGAMRPLLHISKKEIIQIKATRCPIGQYPKLFRFENHIVPVKKGDHIFIYSDGFADQFNGKTQRKYNNRRFKDFLSSLTSHKLSTQKEVIANEFRLWKSTSVQIDDVVVLGIKI